MPIQNKTHINRPLTNMSVAYIQSREGFVANKVFPSIPVKARTDNYFIYNSGQYLTDEVQEVAAGGAAPLINLTYEAPDQYYCKTKKLASQLPTEIIINADVPLDIERDTAELLAQKFLINREITFANNFFKTGCWGTDINGSSSADNSTKCLYWDEEKSSPIEYIYDLKTQIKLSSGFSPNTLVLSEPVYKKLLNHREILARIITKGGDEPAKMNKQTLASLFDIDQIFVMEAIYNPGKEGKIDPSKNEFIGGGKSALLCYVPKSSGIKIPASGYTFEWQDLLECMNGNKTTESIGYGSVGTKRYYHERTSSYFIESWQAYDQKLVGKNLGAFLNNIIK